MLDNYVCYIIEVIVFVIIFNCLRSIKTDH